MKPNTNSPSLAEGPLDGRYLFFHLGAGSYGIDVIKVQEIIRLTPITAVPQLPPHVRGVINIRGQIVPVVDLRVRFHLPDTKDSERNCIVVVQTTHHSRSKDTGFIVDAVDEVLDVDESDAAVPPEFGCNAHVTFLKGMARVRGEVKMLLDIDRVFDADELAAALEMTA